MSIQKENILWVTKVAEVLVWPKPQRLDEEEKEDQHLVAFWQVTLVANHQRQLLETQDQAVQRHLHTATEHIT